MKYAQLVDHGYFILDVKPDSVQANWFFSPIESPADEESFGEAWYTLEGENRLRPAAAPSAPKTSSDIPAPPDPPMLTGLASLETPIGFVLLGQYPQSLSGDAYAAIFTGKIRPVGNSAF